MENKQRKRISGFASFMSLRMLAGLSGQRCIFPFYHTVSCRPPSHIRHLYQVRSEKEFSDDMEYLLKYFEPISINDYLQGRQGNKNQMVLSFDDGLVECHQFIAPYLKQKGIPALFNLNNDFIDNRGLFYRYRASMLVDHLATNKCNVNKASDFLGITEEKVREAILMINCEQRPLLDTLALELEFDEASMMKERPVYMSTEQVEDLLHWGFQIGAHSHDHAEFYRMEPRKMPASISMSVQDIRKRFGVKTACFAFPFTSDGVPAEIVDRVLEQGLADVLLGTAGLKKTGRKNFVQRIPMETLNMDAGKRLRTEYLYYLLKAPLGRNRYFRGAD